MDFLVDVEFENGYLEKKSRFGLEFGYSKPPCGDFETPQPPEWWFMVFTKRCFQRNALMKVSIFKNLRWLTRFITFILASYSGASQA